MTDKPFRIEEYLAPPSLRADWVSGFLKTYVMVLKGVDEEELKELFDMVRFDWEILNGDVE